MWLFAALAISLLAQTSRAQSYAGADHVTRDVCIIGGGASGTYAAVRLQQLGYSVAVIEKQSRLGGHVNTYHDPASGVYFDYGVAVYENISVVSDFFASLNVLSSSLPAVAANSIFANFEGDGKAVESPESLPGTNQTAVGLALAEYIDLLSQYPYLSDGFELPNPVPKELLLPWGVFVASHNLSNLAFTLYTYLQGIGNILAQPTLYVLKGVSLDLARVLLGSRPSFVSSASRGNQELYNQALEQLGDNVFLNSTPRAINRNVKGVEIEIQSHQHSRITTIYAKKLLVAIEPTLVNIQNLGLDITSDEQHLFSQFNNSYYWNAVINVRGLPPDTNFVNVNLEAPYDVPVLPGTYTFSNVPGAPDLKIGYYGSPSYLSDGDVKVALLDGLAKIMRANGYNITGSPQILAFNNHSPFTLTVSTEAIRDGFYRKVNALQGNMDTWWTGAAWQTHDSSQI